MVKVTARSADSPPISSCQVAGSIACGATPLLRTNMRLLGVISSSSKCAGVSALMGRSLSTMRPSLPGICSGELSAAKAAGIRPAGMKRENGMVMPSAVVIATRPLFFRKPRRVNGSLSRPHINRSAAIGSLFVSSCIPCFCFLLIRNLFCCSSAFNRFVRLRLVVHRQALLEVNSCLHGRHTHRGYRLLGSLAFRPRKTGRMCLDLLR